MTLIADYATKKELTASIGRPLKYQEVGIFPEYRKDGSFPVCNRPHITGHKREFFAVVTMVDGLINKVE